MGIFYSTSTSPFSTNILLNESFIHKGWTNQLKPKSPYTGSYLPSVIYVFDYEIDLETVSYEMVARDVQKLNHDLNTKQTQAMTLIRGLELKYKDQVSVLVDLQNQLMEARRKHDSQLKMDPIKDPTGERDLDEEIKLHINNTREHDKEREKAQLREKRSATKIKKLYKKLSSLCHPDKNGNDDYLAEIFYAGKLAYEIGDINVLIDMIKRAEEYKSGHPKRNILERLRGKKKKAKEALLKAKQEAAEFDKSFLSQMLKAKQVSEAKAEQAFQEAVTDSIDDLRLKLTLFERISTNLTSV